jgi:hypothetical protein
MDSILLIRVKIKFGLQILLQTATPTFIHIYSAYSKNKEEDGWIDDLFRMLQLITLCANCYCSLGATVSDEPCPLFCIFLITWIVGWTPQVGNYLATRLLPTHDYTNTE